MYIVVREKVLILLMHVYVFCYTKHFRRKIYFTGCHLYKKIKILIHLNLSMYIYSFECKASYFVRALKNMDKCSKIQFVNF